MNNFSMNVMNSEKILSNYACNKLVLAILLWQLECIFKAGLEQEIDSLKKQLAGCAREKHNLREELSEAYRIKSQLADLHSAEVLKNNEAEKQLKFYQSCVAAAFSERDHALMESEKAKEREEAASERLVVAENRLEELQSAYSIEKKLNMDLEMDLRNLKDQNEAFEKVIDKFYEIREQEIGYAGDFAWQEKCSHLLDDPSDNWIFKSDSQTSTSKYIASLEEELDKRKKSIDNLQSNLKMGFQIERHLKKSVHAMERKQIVLMNTIKSELSTLRDSHNQQRSEIITMLEEETSQMKSLLIEVQEKLNQIHLNNVLKLNNLKRRQQDVDDECRDVHITSDVASDMLAEKSDLGTSSVLTGRPGDAPDTFAQALHEKVAALLLLSQQEERHLLERDVNQALQKKMEEFQRTLSQVTNEKVKALMDLAQLKREYQLLLESSSQVSTHGKFVGDVPENRLINHDQEGKLKNLLKRTYLNRWIGKGPNAHEVDGHGSLDESSHTNIKNIDPEVFARLRVENAALQESMANLEHLTNSIHRLRTTLLKARDDAISGSPLESITEALRRVLTEAKHVKTALGISVPLSWSADAAVDAATYEKLYEPSDPLEAIKERVDPFSSAGLEMVELLILSAELLHDKLASCNSTD